MATPNNGLGGFARRLGALEERAMAQRVHQEAERIGELVSAPADVLLERAVEIAALIEQHGHERTVEIVAGRLGSTPEELETRVRQLASGAA